MTTQPRTAAGRALSRAWRVRRTASPGLEEAWPEQFDRYILAIEAEAAAPGELLGETVEHDGSLIRYVQIVAPLDVERLAEAMQTAPAPASTIPTNDQWYRERARLVAAEYARLSADEEGGT